MATKKTETKAPAKKTTAAAAKKPTAKAEKAASGPRHPHGRVKGKHGSKADLAKSLVSMVAGAGADTAAIESKLAKASNSQLLRLQQVSERVKAKWGSRDKLIAAIGTAEKKSKDKDYLARLESFSLPQLLDLGLNAERRAR